MVLATLKPKLKTISTVKFKILSTNPDSWRNGKESSTSRGYGYKWQKAREGHLRNSPLCVMCQRDGRVTAATVVDHAVPHRGNMEVFWDRENWQSLCKFHHDTEAQARDKAKG